MMAYKFKSIFAKDFEEYLAYYGSIGYGREKIECYFKSLDLFLLKNKLSVKILSESMVSEWLSEKNISNKSKVKIINILNGFSKYLKIFDLNICYLPEKPKVTNDYTPYIFSNEEFKRIIYAADMFKGHIRQRNSTFQFPILLRILYGCGLRVGEAISLKWGNVKIEEGVLLILRAKNNKQRFVPMDSSLVKILKKYKAFVDSKEICQTYLFERKVSTTYSIDYFHEWFCKILKYAEVPYIKQQLHERGPCPHCLRHLFTIRSFQKSATGGRTFMDTAPILSAYLGHDSIMETEKYYDKKKIMASMNGEPIELIEISGTYLPYRLS